MKSGTKSNLFQKNSPNYRPMLLYLQAYILLRRGFKQKKIAIDNGWPVLYSGFAGGT
jgi:hypothetical protein